MKLAQPVQTPFKASPFYYIIIIIGILLLVLHFFEMTPNHITVFKLDGPSMYPTFQTDDIVLITTSSHQKKQLHHGQFVVVKQSPFVEEKMLKRIIGLPGDHLVVEKGQIIRNGEIIEEPYLNEPNWFISTPFDQILKDDEIYVMGDNRNHSDDSRTFGVINLDTQYVGVIIKKVEGKENSQ